MQGRKVAGVFSFLVRKNGLSVECARALHDAVLMPTLLYSSETVYMK